MSAPVYSWLQNILSDAKTVGGAIFGFLTALFMFLIKDIIWAHKNEKMKFNQTVQKDQLYNLYAPLYRFYFASYARYDLWKRENQNTGLTRQAFFETDDEESFAEAIFNQNSKYASQYLLKAWSIFNATSDKALRNKRRGDMVEILIKEYQKLRKDLHMDYDQYELIMGQFQKSA